MNAIVKPGDGILFMKVGTHAQEGLDDIIARKTKEIEDAGFGMWGYGGNTCHPTSMVQPFAEQFAANGRTIRLCMQPMNSRHFATPACAAEFSSDGRIWQTIPEGINVRGSRWALLINSLEPQKFMLPLNQTRVPVGPSQGKIGSRYIKGQADKACLEFLTDAELSNDEELRDVEIGLVAELRPPYAVFLRGER
jgi:hypothetical protein